MICKYPPIYTTPNFRVFRKVRPPTSHNGGYAFKIIFNKISKPLDNFLK